MNRNMQSASGPPKDYVLISKKQITKCGDEVRQLKNLSQSLLKPELGLSNVYKKLLNCEQGTDRILPNKGASLV